MNLFTTVFIMVRRDLILALRHKSELLTALFFFVIVVNLLPLGVGPDPKLLSKIAPGVLWIGALLATLLGLPRLFAHDYQDGSLEQLSLSPHSFTLIVLGKIMAHWLVAGLPVVLITPFLGIQFNLSGPIIAVMMATLLLGTPVLSLIGSIGAALTLGVRGGGVLLSLLILPLYIPVLIFGAGAAEAYRSGLDMSGYFWLLAALDILALFFAPWVSAVALKVALE
ncbi:MAG: heme exporter protein CcmB [Betaproteobacteria bacterium]|nr:heme exporter protein CcmB [Betaproteobacteria bacterium]MDE2423534.1 heme exporter protein CcmB [Betaproteobacteria bacterium]